MTHAAPALWCACFGFAIAFAVVRAHGAPSDPGWPHVVPAYSADGAGECPRGLERAGGWLGQVCTRRCEHSDDCPEQVPAGAVPVCTRALGHRCALACLSLASRCPAGQACVAINRAPWSASFCRAVKQ